MPSANPGPDERPLRIALTADPELPVPPVHYGGIERIVDMLAKGLADRGHHVTLFANPASIAPQELVPWRGLSSRSRADTVKNAAILAMHAWKGRFDLVHSCSRVAYLAPILPLPIPKLMTYQREITPSRVKLGLALSRGTLEISGISRWMMRQVEPIGCTSVVPNGVPLDLFHFSPLVARDAPLVFLGRIEKIKGPHLAIEIARRVGMPLIIAGNIPDGARAWFDIHVAPHIDGRHVRYIGPVDDRQKNELLGAARAFLMPILWEEPFGIVMTEAMACGAPVLGFNRGAVPEVVEDGVTGFVREDVDGLVEAMRDIGKIDRAACRARVEALYSADTVVEGYLQLYRRILDKRPA